MTFLIQSTSVPKLKYLEDFALAGHIPNSKFHVPLSHPPIKNFMWSCLNYRFNYLSFLGSEIAGRTVGRRKGWAPTKRFIKENCSRISAALQRYHLCNVTDCPVFIKGILCWTELALRREWLNMSLQNELLSWRMHRGKYLQIELTPC